MGSSTHLRVDGLLLRPFASADAVFVQALAGDKRIAETTTNIPHPYPDGAAGQWIMNNHENWRAGTRFSFAITLAAGAELVGAISLMDVAGGEAELGYWVGVPYWGRGIASSAARRVSDYGIETWGLQRIHARCLVCNPASSKVLLRAGFTYLRTANSACGLRPESQPAEFFERLSHPV